MFHHLNMCLCACRDMRRPGSSPVKTEGERSPVGQGPPKSCVDVKSERTHDGQEQHSTVDKPTVLSKSLLGAPIIVNPMYKQSSVNYSEHFKLKVCLCVCQGVWRG